MTKVILVSFFLIYLLCSGCSTGIHVMGIDQNGPKDIQVDKKMYTKHIGNALADLHDSVIEPANELSKSSSGNKRWSVKWFNVGFGIEGKVGFIGIATFSARPRIRLYFKRNDNLKMVEE